MTISITMKGSLTASLLSLHARCLKSMQMHRTKVNHYQFEKLKEWQNWVASTCFTWGPNLIPITHPMRLQNL